MARMLSHAARVPIFVACAALFALMLLTFTDVVLRSAFNAPIEAATELIRILMAVVVFSVLPVISARGGHISVDLTDSLFDRAGVSRIRAAVLYLVSGVMMIWPVQRVWILAERSRSYGDGTEYLAIPQFYIGWFITAAVAMTSAVLIVVGIVHLFAPHLLSERRS